MTKALLLVGAGAAAVAILALAAPQASATSIICSFGNDPGQVCNPGIDATGPIFAKDGDTLRFNFYEAKQLGSLPEQCDAPEAPQDTTFDCVQRFRVTRSSSGTPTVLIDVCLLGDPSDGDAVWWSDNNMGPDPNQIITLSTGDLLQWQISWPYTPNMEWSGTGGTPVLPSTPCAQTPPAAVLESTPKAAGVLFVSDTACQEMDKCWDPTCEQVYGMADDYNAGAPDPCEPVACGPVSDVFGVTPGKRCGCPVPAYGCKGGVPGMDQCVGGDVPPGQTGPERSRVYVCQGYVCYGTVTYTPSTDTTTWDLTCAGAPDGCPQIWHYTGINRPVGAGGYITNSDVDYPYGRSC